MSITFLGVWYGEAVGDNHCFESFRERPDLSTLLLTWTVIKVTKNNRLGRSLSGFIEAEHEPQRMTQVNLDRDYYEQSPSTGWVEVLLIMHTSPGYRRGGQ